MMFYAYENKTSQKHTSHSLAGVLYRSLGNDINIVKAQGLYLERVNLGV